MENGPVFTEYISTESPRGTWAEGKGDKIGMGMELPMNNRSAQEPAMTDGETCISIAETAPSPGSNGGDEKDIRAEVADLCHCAPADVEDVYGCTALQEGMMALTLRDSSAYTVEYKYSLPLDVDPQQLQAAWEQTAKANPILRTRIVSTALRGCMQAVIRGPLAWQMESVSEDEVPGETDTVPWKAGEPLAYMTFHLLRRELRIVIHHSICDDWSMALLLQEANKAYRGETLAERPFRPLVDYVHSTRSAAETFWQEKFRDAASMPMSTYPPLPSVGYTPHPGDHRERVWPISSARGDGFTVNTKIRLAWALVQSCYTDSQDVLFGAVNVGRGVPVPGIQEISGPALTTMPVRVQVRSRDTVADALNSIQQDSAAGMPYEHVGLQSLLHLGPGPATSCRFQTLLAVEPRDGHSVPLLFAQHRAIQRNYDLYSLILRCRPSAQTMLVEAWFDPVVIQPRQAERILAQLSYVYTQIEQRPTESLPEIDPLSPQDREDLRRWNGPASLCISPTCVHTLIEQRSRSQGDALAIHSWDGDLSYRILEEKASSLAAHLSSYLVRPGMFVPLYLPKGKWMPIAMLATMKAGAAFVLLDPSYPVSRLQQMCETLQATLLITAAEMAEQATRLGVSSILQVDDPKLGRRGDGRETTLLEVTPASPVYATFTSGSTGTPKGVVVKHGGYAASALAHGPQYNFRAMARVLQFASPAFDSCIIEHLTTLVMGGCVCIPTPAECHSNLAAAMARYQVNIACLTPSVTRIISPESVRALDTLAFVGEPVRARDIARWAPHVQVRNAYGPAECSAVFSVQPRLLAEDPANIGFPTGGVGWVVHPEDPDRLMPLGCTGELMIEGPIVGGGYISNPSQTAKVFVGAPRWRRGFEPAPSTQFYKTGDLVQCAGDGSFRYISRKDTQVKLHGQRLELAEIEHHLHKCFPGAHQVVVEMLRSDSHTATPQDRPDSVLVGFVVSDSRTPEEQDSLFCAPSEGFRMDCAAADAQMSESLPAFMVPAVLLPVFHMPLTASGKTDRRCLRDQASSLSWAQMQTYRTGPASDAQRPANDIEDRLQEIWAQTLNRTPDQIGVTDSFFRLGGDSVSAMQAATGCQTAGWNVTVADIFRCPSVRKMAAQIQELGQTCPFTVEFQDDSADTSFDLSPIQSLFFEHVPGGHQRFTQQFLLRISRPVSASKIRKATETVVARHSMLRARFIRHGHGQWEQLVASEVQRSVIFREHWIPSCEDQSELQGILRESQGLLDSTHGPIFLVDLIHQEEGEDFLGFMAHHLVVDLVSWRVLLQDFEDILSSGRALQPASLSFQQWCRMQRAYALEHLDPKATLPTAVPPAPLQYWGPGISQNTWSEASVHTVSISQETTQAILGSANDTLNTTPVEVLLAAILHSFVDTFPDRPAPTVYTEAHGREPWEPHINISRTVGWFTTMAPLVVDVLKRRDFTEALQLTKDARRAIPGNGWPYFVAKHCHGKGGKHPPSDSPMEILFNYTGLFQQLERSGALLQLAGSPDHDLVPMPPDLPRFALIDVSATVINNALNITFMYNRRMKHQDRLRQWVHAFQRTLDRCPQELRQQQRLTVSDLPLLRLDTDQQLQAVLQEAAQRCNIRVSDIENMYPCSPIQLGMWLAHLKAPDMYWSRIRWAIHPPRGSRAPVDVEKVQTAWQQVVGRHSILRTIFLDHMAGYEQPLQLVRKAVEADIRIVSEDVANWDGYPQDPGMPAHQLLLQSRSDGSLSCQLTIQHTLMDGVTGQIILTDLRNAYNGTLDDAPQPSYGSYVEYMSTRRPAEANDYWMNYLSGLEPCIFPSLPYTGPGQGQKCPAPRATKLQFGTTDSLMAFCHQQGITLSSLLQVAWGLVLRAYTGSESVCFGYLTSGRDIALRDASIIAGPLINLLICRLSLVGDAPIQSILQDTQATQARSIAKQHWSMAHTMNSLGLSGQPLFNTAMSLQMSTADPSETQGTGVSLVSEGGHDSTEYDITTNITIGKKTVHGNLTYWGNAIGDDQMELIADTFQHAVFQLMNPEHRILDDLHTLGIQNESRILEWNRHVPDPVTMSVHSGIEKRSADRPGATAVSAWDGQFTYSELELMASSWAATLRAGGVADEVFVPICCGRTKWTVVAVLAVMKAGGAFILLDPSHPAERLQEMVQENFQCPVILASAEYEVLAASIVPRTLLVDDLVGIQGLKTTVDTFHSHATSPTSPVYAIFTSGTTGKPKPSVIEHRSFHSATAAHSRALGLDEHSRVLQFASFAFDASIVEILTTLLVGGCICMPSQDERDRKLGETIQDQEVNWALLTPSVARILDPKQVPSLQTLVLGGERMTGDDVQRWSPFVDLMNAYGPSECAVIATAQVSSKALSLQTGNIGKATGCVTWLVNPRHPNKPVPVGAPGELLIEGPIVGRGYVHRPEETKVAFPTDLPWLQDLRGSGSPRVYRTGDLARYLPDGSLQYLGRKDRQVKLHGQRIELSEVEQHVLNRFPEPCYAVFAEVVAPEVSGPQYLVAAVVQKCPNEDSDSFDRSAEETRHRLKEEIPMFLIPATFFPLPDVPRLVNGKVDHGVIRKAGTQAIQDRLESAHAARGTWRLEDLSSEEGLLQGLWQDILNLSADTVGPKENFFQLGGDSIAAMKLASACRASGFDLSVPDIFLRPLLCDMALLLSSRRPTEEHPDIPPMSLIPVEHQTEARQSAVVQCNIQEEDIEDILPCTALQAGLAALTAERPGAYVAHHRLELSANVDLDRLRTAWEEVAANNPILRTRLVETAALGCLQVVVRDERLNWTAANDEGTEQISQELPFGKPLVHCKVVSMPGRSRTDLLLTMHHAVYDAWSLPLLLQRVQAAYNAESSSTTHPAPIQHFIQYALSQKGAALDHWRSEFEDLDADSFPPLPSPSFRPRALKEKRRSLETGPFQYSVTRSTAVRLAWALVQSQYQGKSDVVFGMVSTGRTAPIKAVEAMTAPTIATVPLRVVIDPQATVTEALEGLQKKVVQMVPFEQLGLPAIAALSPNASRACAFQTLLNVEGREEVERTVAGLNIMTPVDTTWADGAFNTYAIQLTVSLKPRHVIIDAAFDEAVTPDWQVERMLDQFAHLLDQVHGKPNSTLQDIRTVNVQDAQQLQAWNKDIPPTVPAMVVDLIDEHCTSQPFASAVCAWDGGFNYHELDLLSSALANALESRGVGPEMFVPIYHDRSRWVVIAVLATLKVGAAFVLLDASYPLERLRMICGDIRAPVIITSESHRDVAKTLVDEVVTVAKGNTAAYPALTQRRRSLCTSSQQALYAVFTSGSTGKPKGAILENGAFVTMVMAYAQTSGIDSHSRVLHLASYAFDVSVLELLGTLCTGACVCIPSDIARRECLAEAVQTLQPSHTVITPSLLRALTPADLGSTQTVMLIGEPVRASDVAEWSERYRLMNTYGPAECTVVFTMQPSVGPQSKAANIGGPIAGAAWVTDAGDPNRQVPIGAVGELLLEGPLVGRGYLNNPEQTRAAFIPSPPWLASFRSKNEQSCGTVYRTGDLVRYERDGTLYFLGRKDSQVKLRGQRFELGEVEEQVQKAFQGTLNDVVALIGVPDSTTKTPRLVVFVVPQDISTTPALNPSPIPPLAVIEPPGFESQSSKAQRRLEEVLPSYMLPSSIVPLRQMPRTIGGKLDRRKLRQAVAGVTYQRLEAYAPSKIQKRTVGNEAERTLQRIWARALGIPLEEIGPDDSFFRLGGDSISALQATTKARAVGIDHSVADLFHWRTIMQVAKRFAPSAGHGLQPSANVERTLPCTPAQRGILLSQARDHTSYTPYFIWKVQGHCSSNHDVTPIDPQRLSAAWHQVVARHPALRTAFQQDLSNDGQFEQVIFREVRPRVNMIGGVPDADLVGNTPTVLARLSAKVSQLDGETMPHQLTLCSTSGGAVYARLDISHVIIDAMSMAILESDLCEAYDAPLPPGAQGDAYQQYAIFSQKQSSGPARDYWRTYLEDAEPCRLPSDRGRADTHAAGDLKQLDVALANSGSDIDSFCRGTDWTASSLLYFAWAITLRAFTGSDDVCFGTLTSGRLVPVDGIDRAIGQFSNMSVCRLRMSGGVRVDDIALCLQEDFSNVLSYQAFPLIEIARAAGIPMEQLTSTAINVQYEPSSNKEDTNSLQLTPVRGKDPISQDVTVYVLLEQSGRIRVSMTFNPMNVSPPLAQQLSDYFDLVISALLQGAHRYIRDLTLLTVRDKDRLRRWNAALPPTREICVHEEISQWAQENPDHSAVCGSDGSFTYAELDQLATQLAATLRHCGVTTGQYIPICLDKTRWAPAVILSVLKAGATVVPLDPTQPDSRLEHICEQVQPRLILSSPDYALFCRTLAPEVLEISDATLAYLDDNIGDGEGSTGEHIAVSPSQPAYVLFTSGTTGAPKGVMVSHSSYCYAAENHVRAFSLNPSSRVLQISSYSFDVSMMEILTTLIAGATVCTLTEGEKSQMLVDGACPFPVSHAYLTPSLAGALDANKPRWVDTLVLQGEPMATSHITQWGGNCRLINGYGPTECAVINTASMDLSPGDTAGSIGHGLGIHCWVVDQHDHDRLLPIGAVGELLLNGPAVGEGYLNQPEKTKEVFITSPGWLRVLHPESDTPQKIYKTGDLVRYDAETGALHFEGRKDRQVKVQGQRVELADVEHHTLQCFSGAKQVVVEQVMIPRSSGSNDSGSSKVPRLVACVLCDTEGDPGMLECPDDRSSTVLSAPSSEFHTTATSALRALQERLPTYMVPTLIVPVSRLPLSSSGKADRAGLRNSLRSIPPADWHAYSNIQQSKRPVGGETEARFHKILTGLLNVPEETVGADDNFFHLGGDSILAMKVAAGARAEGFAIRSHDILRHPTISEWARLVSSDQEAPEVARAYDSYSLVTQRERQQTLSSYLDRQHPYTRDNVADIFPTVEFQSFYMTNSSLVSMAEGFPSGLDRDRLYRACAQVMSHYSILRSIFVRVDERVLQVVLDHVDPIFHWVECDDPGAYIAERSREKIAATTALGEVLVSFTVVTSRIRPEWILIVRLSHAQYDGSSLPFLWQAIAAAYEGHELPRTTQFRDVVYNRLGDDHVKPFSFWQDYLRNAPSESADPLQLTATPSSLPADTNPLTIRREIDRLPRLPDITMATLVKGSLAWVLSKHAALPEIILGQVVHGRGSPLPGMETILGPCINFLPIRIALSEDNTIADFLHHVQAQQLATVPHDYVSLEHIISKCTSWPDHTRLGCIVHHQAAQPSGSITLGGVQSTSSTSWANSTPKSGQVGIISIERSNSLDLYMTFPPSEVSEAVANLLADNLVDTIRLFSTFPDYSLNILMQEGVTVSHGASERLRN